MAGFLFLFPKLVLVCKQTRQSGLARFSLRGVIKERLSQVCKNESSVIVCCWLRTDTIFFAQRV
jgi:hypothetical protein